MKIKIHIKQKKNFRKHMLHFAAWVECMGWGYDIHENNWVQFQEGDTEITLTPNELYRLYKKDPTF